MRFDNANRGGTNHSGEDYREEKKEDDVIKYNLKKSADQQRRVTISEQVEVRLVLGLVL